MPVSAPMKCLLADVSAATPLSRLALASLLALAACGGGGAGSSTPPPPPPEVTSVVVSPSSANVFTGQSQTFKAQVTGTGDYNAAVNWSVNGVVGGSSYEAPITFNPPMDPSRVSIEC